MLISYFHIFCRKLVHETVLNHFTVSMCFFTTKKNLNTLHCHNYGHIGNVQVFKVKKEP